LASGTGQLPIPKKIKILVLRLVLGVLRLSRAMWRPLGSLILVTASVVEPVGRFVLRWVVLKPYATALRVRRKFYQLFESSDLLDLLRRHHTVLYLVALSTVAITLNSYKIASATVEDFGQNNLLYPLIQQNITNDLGLDETESTPAVRNAGPLSLSDGTLLVPLFVTTAPGMVGRDRTEYYVVQPGDTLGGIATRFNLQLTTILWENSLTARSVLRLGQKLTILPTDGVTYKIKKGDTAAKVASLFKVPLDDVLSFNPGGSFQVGQTVMVPGGRPLYVAPAPKPVTTISPTAVRPLTSSASSSNSRLLWPTVHRRLTQYYNLRHTGVDIGDPIGTPIYAAEDGVVVTAGWNRGGYGYYIIIDHGGGLQTLYGHTSKMYVKAGDHVVRGQQIADMGSTGRSTGPHLHFEVRINGRRTNPLNYIR
jgi:murein DD-endopeptidase MepM/ murein hydrolase activator NlpD